ncbi:MAG: histidine phosphatase family protein [Candidatus Pacearchaeota archaeon]|jgi:broad specificity phosphatase PhoE
METNLKNRYFFLRHGKNIHQTELKDIAYCWPDDPIPCSLIEEGREDAKKAGELLKDKQINIVFSSDILRCRETAKIVSEVIGFDHNRIVYDIRLRDWNWGTQFGGKPKIEFWNFYNNDKIKAFEIPTPGGESWNQCRERVIKFFNEIESNFQNKNILIVSHGDPLWLLEGYIKKIEDNQILLDKRKDIMLKTGEVREIYE